MIDKQKEIAQKLADEHWEFLVKWMAMIYTDAFIHGYKHGVENTETKENKEEIITE